MKRKAEQDEKKETMVDSKQVKRAYAVAVRTQVIRRREPDRRIYDCSPS